MFTHYLVIKFDGHTVMSVRRRSYYGGKVVRSGEGSEEVLHNITVIDVDCSLYTLQVPAVTMSSKGKDNSRAAGPVNGQQGCHDLYCHVVWLCSPRALCAPCACPFPGCARRLSLALVFSDLFCVISSFVFLPAQRCASAVVATALCPSVSVHHTPAWCRKG